MIYVFATLTFSMPVYISAILYGTDPKNTYVFMEQFTINELELELDQSR